MRGEPNKIAALELGLAESTVASHLGRSLAKMGLPDRNSLLRAFRSITS